MAARITSRDFKRTRSSGVRLDLGRWREFGMGLAVGLSMSVAVLIWQNYREKTAAQVAAEKPRPDARAAQAPEAEDPARSYDFYERLQNIEVQLPDRNAPVSNEREPPIDTVTRPGVYEIQAGSFRNQKDAERLQAQLQKMNIEAQVRPAPHEGGEVFRVRIGPLADLDQINQIRATLKDSDFESKVWRVGD